MLSGKFEIVVETKELNIALSLASSVVEKRNVLTELSHIKITAKGNTLEIVATDMDLALFQIIGVQVYGEGEVMVSQQLLSDIVKKIPDTEIRLTSTEDGDQIEITGQNCRFALLTLPVERFPVLDDILNPHALKIPAKDLLQLIEYTQFAISADETRYNLNGIYLHTKDDHLFTASLDGHRLSVASVPIAEAAENIGVILPKKTIAEIAKIIKDSRNIESLVALCLAPNKVKFTCNNITLISKLIDGSFPDYQDLIPQEHQYKLTVNRQLLADAVDRIAIVTVDKFRAVKLFFKEDGIELKAFGEAKGVGNEKLVYSEDQERFCKFSGDAELEIGFNPKYLTEVLDAVKVPLVEMYINNPQSPALIILPDQPGNQFVVMPVKI